MTKRFYYVGVDLDDDNAVVTCYKSGMEEPETLSLIEGSEVFLIPALIYKTEESGYWRIGEEAKREAGRKGEQPVDRLLTRALSGEAIEIERKTYFVKDLLAGYFKTLLYFTDKSGTAGRPDKVVISVEKVTKELTELFFAAAAEFGVGKENVAIMNRKESFYYYVLNQKDELWLHDVFLFDLRKETLNCCLLTRDIKTSPQVVTLDKAVCEFSGENRDRDFLRILQDCFKKRVISSAFLAGEGFDGEWMQQSIAFLCKGRRVFIGKNLYSKGACYAAAVLEGEKAWPFLYIGDNEMKMNLSIKIKDNRKSDFYPLVAAGENCYETMRECEVILGNTGEIDFWLQLPGRKDAKIERLTLSDLPKRKERTTRLRITAKPLSDTKVQIHIADMGFGEIVKSSGKSWDYTMSV